VNAVRPRPPPNQNVMTLIDSRVVQNWTIWAPARPSQVLFASHAESAGRICRMRSEEIQIDDNVPLRAPYTKAQNIFAKPQETSPPTRAGLHAASRLSRTPVSRGTASAGARP
jgi:hypothetical protein